MRLGSSGDRARDDTAGLHYGGIRAGGQCSYGKGRRVARLRMSGPEMLKLKNLLGAAFDQNTLEVVLLNLDRYLTHYASLNDTLPTAILKTVQRANAELWWRDLLREACNAVPDPALCAFSDEVGFAPDFVEAIADSTVPLKGRQLELKIEESGTTFDILTWRQKIAEIESRVCRIEIPDGQPRGTGFLIGPDLVMTNYHVIRKVHRNLIAPGQVICRFDYKVLADGVSVGPGKPYSLAGDWLVDHSRYSELDYAILRLSGRAGDDMVGGDAQRPVVRKWIGAPPAKYDFAKNPALNIVQHPDGKPMQIAVNSKAVIKASATRVRYTTTTQPGSSGSPCFSADWQWVALHHSGDPKYAKEGKKPEYNQGIPAAAIVALLRQRGVSGIFG
jgi:V8-like Glu-specific endopeptidase